jgi:hypothetical protein
MLKRISILALVAVSCFGQSAQAKTNIKVYLQVQFDGDPWAKSQIESIVSRELRKLGDVQLVSDGTQERSLRILGFLSVSKDGRKLGYDFSAVSTSGRGALEFYIDQWLFAGGDNDSIEDNCKSLVASFDRGTLEIARNLREEPISKPPATPPCKVSLEKDPKPVPEAKPDCSSWKDWPEYQDAREAWNRRETIRELRKQDDLKTLPTKISK